MMQSLPSYAKDLLQLLDILSNYHWEPSYIWLPHNVQSLNTSIPHEVGLTALCFFLTKESHLHPAQARFILKGTQLEHNYFSFKGDFFSSRYGAW